MRRSLKIKKGMPERQSLSAHQAAEPRNQIEPSRKGRAFPHIRRRSRGIKLNRHGKKELFRTIRRRSRGIKLNRPGKKELFRTIRRGSRTHASYFPCQSNYHCISDVSN